MNVKINTTLIILILFSCFSASSYAAGIKTSHTSLRALDKITGRISTIIVKVAPENIAESTASIEKTASVEKNEEALLDEQSQDVAVKFGTLSITVKACFKTPLEETPENAAFIQITENRSADETIEVFSGWMFSSSPALSAIEHSVYDIWVLKCGNEEEINAFVAAENKKLNQNNQTKLDIEESTEENLIETDD